MAERITLQMWEPAQAHKAMTHAWVECLKPMLIAGHRMILEIKPMKRSSPQNARMWAMLADVSAQVDWYGEKLSPQDWKHIFTASMRKTKAVPGIDGGIVVLGQSTSSMTKAEMSDLHMLIEAFAADKGVEFSTFDEEVK
jgi:hypothetical protein